MSQSFVIFPLFFFSAHHAAPARSYDEKTISHRPVLNFFVDKTCPTAI
jgi:hypothetical protein